MNVERIGASFRDPSGFVYRTGGVLYRQVSQSCSEDYDRLMASGLYAALVDKGWLVAHDEVATAAGAYRTLRPQPIRYVSYPYEWCFSQLQDAALLTLDIQDLCLRHGMSLKDASAFNVQFVGARPVFIDTLSFERYREGRPWVAYRQFCEHFLGPLALLACGDPRLRRLAATFIDGVPLDLVSRMLPRRTWLRGGLLMHVHLHARSQRRHAQRDEGATPHPAPPVPKPRMVALVDSLGHTVRACSMRDQKTEWGDYYDATNYSAEAMAAKEALVARMVAEHARAGDLVHDLGANTGRFSRLVAGPDRYVVAHDIDELAVERHYRFNRAHGITTVLPLLLDLTNPSPALGWALEERSSALDRMSRGTVVALALIHHLAISNNVPLDRLADFFARVANTLVIEFVPKDDSQVQRLLSTREDIFPGYTREGFEAAFALRFDIRQVEPVPGSARRLYAMHAKEGRQ